MLKDFSICSSRSPEVLWEAFFYLWSVLNDNFGFLSAGATTDQDKHHTSSLDIASMMLYWVFLVLALVGTCLGANFPIGQKFQIVLNGVPDTGKVLQPADAVVWDVDAEDTTAETITALHAMGKTVICYFSAGTYENWRPDAKQFPPGDLGMTLAEWPNEKWIRLGSTGVRNIMKARISRAAKKGCDAIDPDNTGML